MAKEREEVDLPELLASIRSDATWKKFKTIVAEAQSRLKIEKDREELFAIMASRKVRGLHGKKAYSPSALQEAESKEIEARSRVTEIRMKASIQLDHVEAALRAVENHVRTEYAEQMRGYTSEAQRTALVQRVQRIAKELMTDGKALLDMCDRIVEDIDKCGYKMTNMTNIAINMVAGRAH